MKFDEMKVLEKSIVPIYEKNCIDGSNFHEPVIDARELWAALGSKQEFANWMKNRIENYGFQENADYCSFDKIVKRETGATTRKEYLLTMDTAKEIAMVENNEKGRMANQNGLKTPEYGIQVWDKSRHSAKQVPSWRYNDRAVERLREILGA